MEDYKNTKWDGYLRKDGRKGIRNKVLIIYTVECSSFVAKSIEEHFRNTDADVDVIGFSGCYDNEYAIRMMIAMIKHPNVGAVLPIGLGCEYNQPTRLADIAKESEKLADWLSIQDCGGTIKTIKKGIEIVNKLLEELKETTEIVKMGFEDLIVGAECGGSDFTSGLAGNVIVGKFFDTLVEFNGTAIFEEIIEAVGLKKILLDRAVSKTVKKELAYTYDKALDYCKSVRQYSVSPGNFAGGLTTIEEKSMGAVVKSGSKLIQGVIKVSQLPKDKGLWLLDSTPDPHWMNFGYTNPNDNEGMMDLIACGAHIVFLVTGRGNVVGNAIAPVVKVTGNSETYSKMSDDMDFNAGRVLSGEKSIEDLTYEMIEYISSICSGQKTKAEILGHKEYFIPYKYQEPTVDIKCK